MQRDKKRAVIHKMPLAREREGEGERDKNFIIPPGEIQEAF